MEVENTNRDKVFIICSERIFAQNLASSSRVLNYAKALVVSNVDVYFSSITLNKIKRSQIKKIQDGIFIVDNYLNTNNRLFSFFLRNSFIITSIYLFILHAYIKNLKGRNTILLYPSVDYTMEPMCLLILKYLFSYPLFCEINELRRAGVLVRVFKKTPKGFLFSIISKIRYLFYLINEPLSKYFDGLIVISSNLDEYYRKYNQNIIKVPILTDINLYSGTNNIDFTYKSLFKIGFSGQINIKKENLDILFKAIALVIMEYPNIRLDLYGSQDPWDKLILDDLRKKNELNNIIFYKGIVPQSELISALSQYHLLVIPRTENLQTKYGFSTKLSDYLLTGVPVLATNISDVRYYLNDNVNAFILSEISISSISEKILDIIKTYDTRKETIKAAAYKLLENDFDYRKYSKALYEFLIN